MTDTSINWRPLDQMPLVARMIDESLTDTGTYLGTLTKVCKEPHKLDDATIDRVESVHTEQMEFVGIYAAQIKRWRAEKQPLVQMRELDRMETQNQKLQAVTAEVLTLAVELRKDTINRVLERSDLELGLQAVLGELSSHS
jgi:hypothetical protein